MAAICSTQDCANLSRVDWQNQGSAHQWRRLYVEPPGGLKLMRDLPGPPAAAPLQSMSNGLHTPEGFSESVCFTSLGLHWTRYIGTFPSLG
jgi:hypothetical protein